jgi:hypothetical protein
VIILKKPEARSSFLEEFGWIESGIATLSIPRRGLQDGNFKLESCVFWIAFIL